MLLKDVRELLYEDVETDIGPSAVTKTAADEVEQKGQPSVSDSSAPGVIRDSQKRVIRHTDANGNTTRFDYGALPTPRRITFADGSRFDFHYSDKHILKKFCGDDTLLAKYEANAKNGSWKVDYADGTRAAFRVKNGRIVRAVNRSGTVELNYDDHGRLMTETFEGRTVTYHRNASGHLIGITTPFGQIIHYHRDNKNRVNRIKDWSGQDIRIEYSDNGAMACITYPNGARFSQTSTTKGLPKELRLVVPGDSHAALHRVYRRNHLQRITQINCGDKKIIYTYDTSGRLTGVDGEQPGRFESFSLDPNGNRLSDHHQRYSINENDQVMKAAKIEYQYDRLGNLIKGTCPLGHARYQYFGLNRLRSFSMGDVQAQYRYDAFGRRVAKKVNGITTRFFWAGNQLLHEVRRHTTGEQKSTGVTDYLFFPGRPALLAICQDEQMYWAAFGHRYEVMCLTSDDGQLVWQASYDGFGQAQIEKGSDIYQPFRLAGQYLDKESGLHYSQHRYYDPKLGRYLSISPAFLESGSNNFYTYAKGDPVNYVEFGGTVKFSPKLSNDAGISDAEGLAAEAQISSTATERDLYGIMKGALLGGVASSTFNLLGTREEPFPDDAASHSRLPSAFSALTATGTLSAPPKAQARKHRGDTILKKRSIGLRKSDHPSQNKNRKAPPGVTTSAMETTTEQTEIIAKPTETEFNIRTDDHNHQISNSNPSKTDDQRRYPQEHQNIEAGHINALTGEVAVNRKDFALAGRIPMVWSCHYQSHNTYTGLLGLGWQSPADARLEVDKKGSVLFFDGRAAAVRFDVLPTDDTPAVAAVNGALLSATPTNYQVYLKSGLIYHFPKKIIGGPNHVVRISDVHENFLSFYREDANLTQIRHNSDQFIHIKCDEGRIVSMRWLDQPLTSYRYEGDHLVAAQDAMGHQKCYYYSNGVMVRHMDKNKHSHYYKYDDAGRCTRKWDDSGFYEYQFDYPRNECRTIVTDSIGNKRIYTYKNHLQTVIQKDHPGIAVSIDYDQTGRVTAFTDELNRSTTYQYDARGNRTGVARSDTQLISVTYDNNHRPVKTIDANGRIWEQCFNANGQIIEAINPLGKCVQYKYNRFGDLTEVIEEGVTTKFDYDDHGLVSAVNPGSGHQTIFQRDSLGKATAVIDPAGEVTRYTYDKKGRLVQAIQPSGISQSFDWDPEDNLLIHTDPNGRQTRFAYGAGNRITRRHNADNTCVSFQYDTEENLISIINERGQCHHNKYDHAGRITAQTDYFGHTCRFAYDAAGQLIEQVDPLGKTVTCTYDPLGRLETKSFDGVKKASFKWDGNGNLIAFNTPEIPVQRHYDAANQLSSEKKATFSIDYQYDRSGRPILRTTSHGNRVQFGYDAMGAVSSIKINDQSAVTIERNGRGQIIAEHFSGSLHRSFSYDQDGLLTCQTINGVNGEIERRYSYDGAANLIAKQDSHKGDWRFSYDAMDRIIEAVDPKLQTHRFAYDPCGDLINHLPVTKESLRCAQYNDIQYFYDAAGNLVQRNDGRAEYHFDWHEYNRLTTISKGDKLIVKMVYDALGRRHAKFVNDKCTIFNWEGRALISEQKEKGPIREYVYHPDTLTPFAVIVGNKQVYYYHNDINGLPLELTKPNGKIVWSADYDALGRIRQHDVKKIMQPLRLPGHYFDEEIGLSYDGMRYFDPISSAYISQNPKGLADGENLYTGAPNVWTRVDNTAFCKSHLKKRSLRKRQDDIISACVIPVPRPQHHSTTHCLTGDHQQPMHIAGSFEATLIPDTL